MKKKTRRSLAKYPALEPSLNLKNRQNLLDYDYLDKLSDEEKQWLNDFSAEYHLNDFKTHVDEGRKRIHKKKKTEHKRNKDLKKLKEDFQTSIKQFTQLINNSQVPSKTKLKLKRLINKFKKQINDQIKKDYKFIKDYYKKESEDQNNARNADTLSTKTAQGMLKSLDILPETYLNKSSLEDSIIEKIDNERLSLEKLNESDD